MSDATDAIIDIEEAILEYGSDIVLNVITYGEYNPIAGEGLKTTTPHVMKALPGNYTNKELQDPNVHIKDKKFRFYYTGEITYDDQIEFRGDTYSIERIDSKIFQDELLLYTIQGRI